MPIYTLTNNFHNTSSRVRPIAVTNGRFNGLHKISHKTALRLRAELCGGVNCQCGRSFGERGGIIFDVVCVDYDRNYYVDLRQGNAREYQNGD